MNEKKREGTFIPCGDSLEKMEEMEEISEELLESVSGGEGYLKPVDVDSRRPGASSAQY